MKLRKLNFKGISTGELLEEAFTENAIPKKKKGKFLGISSGDMLLNLACSDNYFYAFPMGKVINIIGDSSSGKSLLALSIIAEASHNDNFEEYRLIYDDVEAALEFNIENLFGIKTKKRLNILDEPSDTIESFYAKIAKLLTENKPFIYVLDSFDALTSEDEKKRVKKMIKNLEKEGDINDDKMTGSYKVEKAKIAGEILRVIARDISKTQSLLIIISQTREKIGVTFGETRTRSGGKALRFYSTHEIWLAVESKIKNEKTKLNLGIKSVVKISKNKLTGKIRTINLPIYYDYGIDSIGNAIDFLIENGWWKKRGGFIEPIDLLKNESFQKRELIKIIEKEKLEKVLGKIVQRCWDDREESVRLDRKKKYE